MEENKEVVKEEKKWLKVTKTVVNVFFYVLIALLLVFSISNLTRDRKKLEVASIFGNGYVTVVTDSMDGDKPDSFDVNALLFVKKVTDKNRNKMLSKLKVGDIITFKYYDSASNSYFLNTHRIVEIKDESGNLTFITQGDKNALRQRPYVIGGDNDGIQYETVVADDVRAIYTGKLNSVGKAMKFLQTSNGFLIFIVIPVAIFFIVQLLMLILNINNYRKLKSDDGKFKELEELKKKQAETEEEMKARLRAEILAEQAKNDSNESNK